MSGPKRRRQSRRSRDKAAIVEKSMLPALTDSTKEKHSNICIIILLLLFGLYKSILLFGAMPVPNPDYPGFVRAGEALLRFELPHSFKRAPVLGVIQVFVGRFMGGMNPTLTASWLVNHVFGTLSLVFLYLIGKRVIGKAAIGLVFVAMLNPLVVRYELVPIAETAITFFAVITFYFIFKHSNWAYLFASLASMVRYEGAALILIVFLMDMVTKKTKKHNRPQKKGRRLPT